MTDRAMIEISKQPEAIMAFIETVGTAFGQGGLPGCKGVGQGKALALTCLMEGLTPLQFMLQYHLIDGRPSKQATTLLAEYEAMGGQAHWISLGDDGKEARARWKFKHHDVEIAYTVEEAKAQVGKKMEKEGSSWKNNLGSMLRARLITKALRIVCPQVVAGIYTPDELGHEELTEYNVIDAVPVSEPIEVKEEANAVRTQEEPVEQEQEPSEDEIIDAADEGREKDLEEQKEELLKDNPQEKMMRGEEEPAPKVCSQQQLNEMKELIDALDFKRQFDEAMHKMKVPGAKYLTVDQADKCLDRLRALAKEKGVELTAS